MVQYNSRFSIDGIQKLKRSIIRNLLSLSSACLCVGFILRQVIPQLVAKMVTYDFSLTLHQLGNRNGRSVFFLENQQLLEFTLASIKYFLRTCCSGIGKAAIPHARPKSHAHPCTVIGGHGTQVCI